MDMPLQVGAQWMPEELPANKSSRHCMYQAVSIGISMYWNQYFPFKAKRDTMRLFRKEKLSHQSQISNKY
jgi:hypothetical protein